MSGNPYNGFSGAQRRAAVNWSSPLRAAGVRKPKGGTCEVCSAARFVSFHSEDYSLPFGEHIGAYELCFLCHTILHLRFKDPAGFDRYRHLISSGAVFPLPYDRQLYLVLNAMKESARYTMGAPRGRTALDEVAEGLLRTRSGVRPVAGVLAAEYGQEDWTTAQIKAARDGVLSLL